MAKFSGNIKALVSVDVLKSWHALFLYLIVNTIYKNACLVMVFVGSIRHPFCFAYIYLCTIKTDRLETANPANFINRYLYIDKLQNTWPLILHFVEWWTCLLKTIFFWKTDKIWQSIFFLMWSIWNNSFLNCGYRWKWRMIIAVNFPI